MTKKKKDNEVKKNSTLEVKTESFNQNIKTIDEAIAESVFKNKFAQLEKKITDINYFMGAIVVALFVAFIALFGTTGALLNDVFTNKQSAYESYLDVIKDQEQEILNLKLESQKNELEQVIKKEVENLVREELSRAEIENTN